MHQYHQSRITDFSLLWQVSVGDMKFRPSEWALTSALALVLGGQVWVSFAASPKEGALIAICLAI